MEGATFYTVCLIMAMMMARMVIRIMAMMMSNNLLHGEDDHDDGILSGFHVSGSTICSPHNQVPKLAAGLQDFHSEKCRQFSLSPKPWDFAKSKDSGSSLDPNLQILDISTDSVDDFHLSQSLSDGTRSRTHTYMYTCIVQHIFKAFVKVA